ncbi:MAG: hypothetical protein LBB82_11070 [Treponema sp.]|jgi:hypothetical protein|nr:hypothetical protein [Treponema sp.]
MMKMITQPTQLLKGKACLFAAFLFLPASLLFCQRSFNDVYPGLDSAKRAEAFSRTGFSRIAPSSTGFRFLPVFAKLNISSGILSHSPRYLAESVRVIPYGRSGGRLVQVYNAFGRIRFLKGRMYHSSTRDKDVPLFSEATRIEGPNRNRPIPDAGPAAVLPASETMYLRLKDTNFGNTFLKAQLSTTPESLLYHLTNYKTFSFVFFPIIKENSLNANLYVEPLKEGFLVYSAAGVEVSDFIDRNVDIASAIDKRLQVIIEWFVEGINTP